MSTTIDLPPAFFIGASTSPHQTEGNNISSDWWALENADGSPIRERSGDACDSFLRWREDMDLLRSLGFDSYRFGVEWARVEPERGRWSASAILHYREMVRHAKDIGLEPIVTLHHFTSPAWFSRAGGWEHPEAEDRFLAYVDAIAPVIDAGAETVVTINEPNILAVMQTVRKGGAALETGLGGGLPEPDAPTSESLIRVHRATVDRLRAAHPGVRTGWSIANQAVQHVEGGEETARTYAESREDRFLRESRGDDFVGVQAYTRTVFGPEGVVPPAADVPRTLTGWEYHPPALGEAVRHTASMLPSTPIVVTENGIATDDDEQRIAYTTGALEGLTAAMKDGADVRGYLHWSALDNYEWGSWAPTFGLIAVDRETFARTPKPSARWLGALARSPRAPRISVDREDLP